MQEKPIPLIILQKYRFSFIVNWNLRFLKIIDEFLYVVFIY